MIVFERDLGGEGEPPLVILHGLLGSGRNWLTAGAALMHLRRVYVLDLPNHGDAPHTDTMSYQLMCDGLIEWLDERRIERMVLIGHSMGGKLSMRFACDHPERVERLVVVDIAPRHNPGSHATEFEAMLKLDIDRLSSRREAEEQLEQLGVRSWGMRQFLLTNLDRGDDGKYRWRINLPVLAAGIAGLARNPLSDGDRFDGPTLFIRSLKSNFIADENIPTIRRHFPAVTIVPMECGHNPHIDAREELVGHLSRWMAGVS